MKLLNIFNKLLFIFVLSILFVSSNSSAQENGKNTEFADGCEIISLKLDGIGIKFNEIGKEKSNLIIIGTLLKNEKSFYTDKRISDAIKYLTKFHNIKTERIVYGTRSLTINKLRSLEFYINGEFIDEIKTSGRSKLCFGMGYTF